MFREMGIECACEFSHQEAHDVAQEHMVLNKGSIFPSPLSNEQYYGILFPGLLSELDSIQTWPIREAVFKMFIYLLRLCQ